MLLAQITDPHVTRLAGYYLDTADALARCVAQVCALSPAPDACLLTGDLAERATAAEYALVREIIAPLSMPCFVIPGNHDDRSAMREAFSDHTYLPPTGEFLHYTLEDWPLRIIALDTVIPGKTEGTVCETRLRWLTEKLSEAPQRPTLIMMHHPPFKTGIAALDAEGFDGGAAFGETIAPFRNIEAIVCGHVHRAMQTRFYGTLVSTCPGSAHQIALDFSPTAPLAFTHETPGFQLHTWQPGQGLVTHTVCVGNFPGPFPYNE